MALLLHTVPSLSPAHLLASMLQMELDGVEAKSQFGGSNKRARTAAASEWDSQVFSDDEAEADVRTKLGAATLSGETRKARSAGVCVLHHTHTAFPSHKSNNQSC